MAVNSIVFGGIDSADYGIYISGEGVFNAPKRDVEMIEIPGRNGAFALDKGRFENIEVTYPAFNFEPGDYNTFAKNLSDFRNAICSLKGYQRLTDSFHPNEYRMAVYRDGLEVKPIKYNTASEFDITFDCKPQRWLTSGETAVSIASSGDTITNPTLFESGPLLEVEGHGTIGFNGYEIELENAVMGDVLLADKKTSGQPTFYNDFSLASLNAGDTITVNGISVIFSIFRSGVTISSVSDSNSDFSTTYKVNGNYYYFTTTLGSFTGQKGTYAGKTNTTTISGTNSNGAFTINVNYTLKLDNYYQQPNDGFCSIEYAYTDIVGHEFPTFNSSTCGTIRGNSTMSLLGNPTYVDCDLGECYLINGGDVVSLNAYIDLGSKLPTLAPGSNAITYDNTITDLKVTPRWWRV